MKRKPKVEAPKEAWAVVSPQNSAVINFARTMVPEGFAEVRYVPADPHAKLKADVVRAAERYALLLRTTHTLCMLSPDEARVVAAVKKLQKVKP